MILSVVRATQVSVAHLVVLETLTNNNERLSITHRKVYSVNILSHLEPNVVVKKHVCTRTLVHERAYIAPRF